MSRQQVKKLAGPAYPDNESDDSEGALAFVALANNATHLVDGQNAAQTGDILTNDLSLTAKVSGKFLVTWAASGPADGATTETVFSAVATDGVTPQNFNQEVPAGTGSNKLTLGAGSFITSAFAVGSTVTFNVSWDAGGGHTFSPVDGSVSVIELPG